MRDGEMRAKKYFTSLLVANTISAAVIKKNPMKNIAKPRETPFHTKASE
jgi:hypothetical protein